MAPNAVGGNEQALLVFVHQRRSTAITFGNNAFDAFFLESSLACHGSQLRDFGPFEFWDRSPINQ